MTDELIVRRGERRDAGAIAAFNSAMAQETEGRGLIPEVVGAGVSRLLGDPALGFYVVAQHQGQVVGCLMVTREWSDWRNGTFWWIQSVYVVPPWRRKGVYRRLYDFIREQALADPGVCGFRLYVEKENTVAQATYDSLGMAVTNYLIYEEIRPGAKFFAD